MEIEIFDTCNELGQRAGDLIFRETEKNKQLLLCAATGDSPTETYRRLAEKFRKQPDTFDQLRIIKLDEWGGIPMEHPATCESYVRKYILGPLHISNGRYTGFNSDPEDPILECRNIQDKLDKEGPIDLCILGLGMNGHIALNEPDEFLQAHCHVAALSASSLQHPMASEMKVKPAFGLTLGMADIMHSKMILMLISGSKKRSIVKKFLSKEISSTVPASFLWLHPNFFCLIEKDAMDEPALGGLNE